MSGAQDRRREGNIESAREDLDRDLAPYRESQTKLRAQIAESQTPAQTVELQKQLDAVTEKIGQVMEGSLWWRLYEKD